MKTVYSVDTLFRDYFHRLADLAEQLASQEEYNSAYVIAASALDSLAAIWVHDFPPKGKISSALRQTRFLKHFAASDPDADKVAVVYFAEELKKNCPIYKDSAERVIDNHKGRSDLDVSRIILKSELPELESHPGLFDLAEHYEYGSILYRFYRCPFVHSSSAANRIHNFTPNEERVWYLHSGNFTQISIGIPLVIRWLRCTVSNYVEECFKHKIRPANNYDPGSESEENLTCQWRKI